MSSKGWRHSCSVPIALKTQGNEVQLIYVLARPLHQTTTIRNKDSMYVSHKLVVVLDFLSKLQGNQVQLIYVLAHPLFRGVL